MSKPPGKAKGDPPKQSRPAQIDSSPATADAPAEASDVLSVRRKRSRGQRTEAPKVFASAFAPCPGRELWALSYICPWCGFGHFGRARTEAKLVGKRRTRCCGRLVFVKIAKAYRGGIGREAA